jgi:hypothetical protein
MAGEVRVRGWVVALGGLLLAVVTVVAPRMTGPEAGVVSAQSEPAATMFVIQTPPPVPGLAYPDEDRKRKDSAGAALIPGTPVPPQSPDSASLEGVAEEGGTVSASLGGSDVAVTSEGGSYEVDAPKRRARKAPQPSPQP